MQSCGPPGIEFETNVLWHREASLFLRVYIYNTYIIVNYIKN